MEAQSGTAQIGANGGGYRVTEPVSRAGDDERARAKALGSPDRRLQAVVVRMYCFARFRGGV